MCSGTTCAVVTSGNSTQQFIQDYKLGGGERLSGYIHMYNPHYIITMHIIKSKFKRRVRLGEDIPLPPSPSYETLVL